VPDTFNEISVVPTEAVRDTEVRKLTSASLLARNTIWNLVGQAAPMGAALFAVPLLIRYIGTDRFGILFIAWTVVGYFSLFDLGLGRAMTNLVAQGLGGNQQEELAAIIWTANGIMAVMGIVGAVVLAAASPLLTHSLLKIPPNLQQETLHSLFLLSIAVPLVVSTAGFRGILEAQQKFALLNLVKIPMGVASFLAPVAMLPFTNSLTALIGALVVARIIFLVACIGLALRTMPALRHSFALDKALMCPLLSLGGWMTVSNIVSPIMVYADRFLIGGILSTTAVAYYATSNEIATKILIVPVALAGVLFPAFSTTMASDRFRGAMLYRRAVKYVGLFVFPLSFVMIVFGQELLRVWLGHDFAVHSTRVLQILSLGVLANSLALIPFALIQGAGRADISGKLHLAELPFYLALVWYLTVHYGIVGTAVASLLRVTGDCILMFLLADYVMGSRHRIMWPVCGVVGVGTVVVVLFPLLRGSQSRLFAAACALAFCGLIAWRIVLSAEERFAVLRAIRANFILVRAIKS
jgi:O-antigen/teichoic acid export membrane protein